MSVEKSAKKIKECVKQKEKVEQLAHSSHQASLFNPLSAAVQTKLKELALLSLYTLKGVSASLEPTHQVRLILTPAALGEEYFEEMISPKPERQFQIGRITNFFT